VVGLWSDRLLQHACERLADEGLRGEKDLWGLRPQAGNELADYVGEPVRIADLAIWYGRLQDVRDLDALIAWFKETFPVDQAGLIGTVYTDEVPAHYRDIPFAPAPLTQSEYAEARRRTFLAVAAWTSLRAAPREAQLSSKA
jgi:hypothetical protein